MSADIFIKRVEQTETEILITISILKTATKVPAAEPPAAPEPPSSHAVTNNSVEAEATSQARALLEEAGMLAAVEPSEPAPAAPSPAASAAVGEGPFSAKDRLAELTPKQRLAVAQRAKEAGIYNVNGDLTGAEYGLILEAIAGVR